MDDNSGSLASYIYIYTFVQRQNYEIPFHSPVDFLNFFRTALQLHDLKEAIFGHERNHGLHRVHMHPPATGKKMCHVAFRLPMFYCYV